jgi:hypothetical protein
MLVEHCQILGSIAYTARGIKRKKDITPEFVKKTFVGFPRKTADGNPHPYGIGYRNHPCTQWTAASIQSYMWLCELTFKMCGEYTKRYGRKHACEEICRWYASNRPELPAIGIAPFAQAMPEDCKSPDAVKAYRDYYKKYKARFAKWAHSERPPWFDI